MSGALAAAARSLVAENGYDDTTIEMIAERAGVSRRTFFRHFETKDAVLLHFYDELGDQIVESIENAPADLPMQLALSESFRIVERFLADPIEQASQSSLVRMISESPRLDAARNYRRRRTVELATLALMRREERAGRDCSRLVVGAISGATFSCLYSAEQEYLKDTSQNPVALFEEAATGVYRALTETYEYQQENLTQAVS